MLHYKVVNKKNKINLIRLKTKKLNKRNLNFNSVTDETKNQQLNYDELYLIFIAWLIRESCEISTG